MRGVEGRDCVNSGSRGEKRESGESGAVGVIGVVGHVGDVHCVGDSARLKNDVGDDGVCGSNVVEFAEGSGSWVSSRTRMSVRLTFFRINRADM